jgi:hypothetical protein
MPLDLPDAKVVKPSSPEYLGNLEGHRLVHLEVLAVVGL